MKLPRLFPGIIFVLLGMNMLIVGVTVYAANSDGGAVIEPDYYRKALAFDVAAARKRADAALGWTYNLALTPLPQARSLALTAGLVGGDGLPLTGAEVRAVAFPSAHAGERHSLLLRETAPAAYSTVIDSSRGGLWRIELTIRSRGEVATFTSEIQLPVTP